MNTRLILVAAFAALALAACGKKTPEGADSSATQPAQTQQPAETQPATPAAPAAQPAPAEAQPAAPAAAQPAPAPQEQQKEEQKKDASQAPSQSEQK